MPSLQPIHAQLTPMLIVIMLIAALEVVSPMLWLDFGEPPGESPVLGCVQPAYLDVLCSDAGPTCVC